MKDHIQTLIKLQKLETEIVSVQAALNSFPQKQADIEIRLTNFQQTLDTQKADADALQKKYRGLDSDVKTRLDSIQKTKSRLNSVKNNKEYQALLKEIEESQKKVSCIEDDMLVLLDEIEKAEAETTLQNKNYKKLKQQIKTEKTLLVQEAKEQEAKLVQLNAKKAKVTKKIPDQLLKNFTAVKEQQGGIGITAVKNGVCEQCNMSIPPQFRNDIRRYEILNFCPFCHRMIYCEEEE